MAQFEFSCTYFAHGHGVQQNVGLTFFIQRLQTFFLFLPRFYVFNVFKIFVWTFLHLWLTKHSQHPRSTRVIRLLWKKRWERFVLLLTDNSNSVALPVVLFVHCESYIRGTGNAYDGSVLAAFGHVIVVTVNFRLGVLGKNGCLLHSDNVKINGKVLLS